MPKTQKDHPLPNDDKRYEGNDKPQRKRDGRERKVHEEIIARRMQGGAAPTPEAYAKALEEWQQLPGSVVRPPTDVTPPAEEPPKTSKENPTNTTPTAPNKNQEGLTP